ncbi:MAG TPA: PD-(D/E)XK nuclease family protein [Candidatus Solibacter sp.]|nr:PD-(D/E)XK nuclease family protein [Candidatus Solibacter sp.]
MIFSHTQINNYLRCPRSYRYRYLDGWQERDTRAGMVFGRCFEKALAAMFHQQDPSVVLYQEWSEYRSSGFEYKKGESWDRMLHQGIHLLQRFAQGSRVCVSSPAQNLQVKIVRSLTGGHEFVSYIDAIGTLDGDRCVLDWKTTTTRYPDDPPGIHSLDPQLICYSWMSGISQVALVVFVRKHAPEIQYLKATISEQQRQEFGRLVESTVEQITSGEFPSHSGIRFPQSACLSCANLGLCLRNQSLIERKLIRIAGAQELDWLDELVD